MAEEEKKPGTENGTPLTFDEILEDKEYQSEFDKRVAKALETAKSKWEAKAEAAKAVWEAEAEAAKKTAVDTATEQLGAELTKAMIKTELVKSKARDVDVIMPLIDTAKVTRGENGLEGLAQQIKSLQESKAFLFESADDKPKGKTGLDHGAADEGADDVRIRKIMGLPPLR